MMVKEQKKKNNMAASTAVAAAGGNPAVKQFLERKKKQRAGKAIPHGDEAHIDSGTEDASESAAPVEEDTPVAFKSSPAKIKNVGYNYKPFEMKAKGHNNSPIEKNYGSPAQRGIATSKGLAGGEPGKPQAKTGVGSGINFAAVGSSPA